MTLDPVPPVNPADYPRTYRVSPGWLAFLLTMGVAAILGGGGLAWLVAFDPDTKNRTVSMLLATTGFLFVPLGVYLIVDTLKSKLTLTADAIELVDLRPARRLGREDIVGYTVQAGQTPRVLVLMPRHQGSKRLKLALIMRLDAAFHAWMAGIPDLDAEAARRAEAALLADASLGATSTARAARLARGRKLVRALDLVVAVAVAWGIFWPRPYGLAMLALALLPWVGVAAVVLSGQFIRLDAGRNDAHPTVAFVAIGPPAALALRAVLDVVPVAWLDVLPLAVGGGLGFVALLALAARELRGRAVQLLVFALIGAVYAYGAGMLGNALLDRARTDVYRTAVLSKHVSSGRGHTTNLKLAPWGPRDAPDTVTVSHDVYDAVQPGGVACVHLRPGALGIAWYVVAPCR